MGHEVVRFPPYHCQYNPIELIWAQFKGRVADKNSTFKIADVEALVNKEIDAITADVWAKCGEHCAKLQEDDFHKAGLRDEIQSGAKQTVQFLRLATSVVVVVPIWEVSHCVGPLAPFSVVILWFGPESIEASPSTRFSKMAVLSSPSNRPSDYTSTFRVVIPFLIAMLSRVGFVRWKKLDLRQGLGVWEDQNQ